MKLPVRPKKTADPQNDSSEETGTDSQEFSYSAEITTEDGSGILDFGSAEEGYTVIPDAQYVSIKNTGTGELNFKNMSPDHFMVAVSMTSH